MLAASHGRLPFPIGTNGAAAVPRHRHFIRAAMVYAAAARAAAVCAPAAARRAGSRSRSLAPHCLPRATLAVPLVCPLLARSGYVPPPAAVGAAATPPPIHSGPWVQVGVSAFRFRSAIHGGHF